MNLVTYTDYIALWVVLYVVTALAYVGYCTQQHKEVENNVVRGISYAAFWLCGLLWAVRRLWF